MWAKCGRDCFDGPMHRQVNAGLDFGLAVKEKLLCSNAHVHAMHSQVL